MLASTLTPSAARAITEPPCSGLGAVAYYAGPPLPPPPTGNGFYESNPTYTLPSADQGSWRTSTPGAQGMTGTVLQTASTG